MNVRTVLVISLGVGLAMSAGCGKKKGHARSAKAHRASEAAADEDPVAEEARGDQDEALPELDPDRAALVDELGPPTSVIPMTLGRALVGAPRAWAKAMVSKVFPSAEVLEDNPRVNLLFEVGKVQIDRLDVRWDPFDRDVVGSVVLVYQRGVDTKALEDELGKVATKGEGRDWAAGRGLKLVYYEKTYDGRTTLTFTKAEESGGPITHDDEQMKKFERWKPVEREADRRRRR